MICSWDLAATTTECPLYRTTKYMQTKYMVKYWLHVSTSLFLFFSFSFVFRRFFFHYLVSFSFFLSFISFLMSLYSCVSYKRHPLKHSLPHGVHPSERKTILRWHEKNLDILQKGVSCESVFDASLILSKPMLVFVVQSKIYFKFLRLLNYLQVSAQSSRLLLSLALAFFRKD